LVIRGPAGIGKSTLLDAAAAAAAAQGVRVLTATGIQSEARIPFAGLHQLLRPILHLADGLPRRQRAALESAFGMSDDPDQAAPGLLAVGLAALELASAAATATPVLLVIEDAQWLDESSRGALAFAARRLAADPVAMLAAVRADHADSLGDDGLPELELAGLDEESAAELLSQQAPDLEARLRDRVLAEAAGNPLALVELPVALRDADVDALPSPLPLTDRLERAFAAHLPGLPAATRAVLLAAAADDEGIPADALRAASLVTDVEVSGDAFTPAVAARLIEVGPSRLRFRHPLVRSAVYQAASWAQRQAIHAALAIVLDGQPDRRVWHRAAAATGPDEEVAAELDDAAARAERRGATATAISALRRAAELSKTPASRGRRFVRATSLAFANGQTAHGADLLRAAGSLELSAGDRLWLSYLSEAFSESGWSGVAKVGAIAGAIDPEYGRIALTPLLSVALRCWWGNPSGETRAAVVQAAERLPLPKDDPAVVAVLAFADPLGHGADALCRIARAPIVDADPVGMYHLGLAASAVWDYELTLKYVEPAVLGLRAQGRAGLLPGALVTQAWAAVHLARQRTAISAADEAYRLGTETRQRQWLLGAQLAKAAVAAERGEQETVDSLTREAEAALLAAGANPLLAMVQFVRGRAAMVTQRYPEGLEHLRRALDPGEPGYHPFVGYWALADLVEAAMQCGDPALAHHYLELLESLAARTSSPNLRAQAAYARPLVAADDQAEGLYRLALDHELTGWYCLRGRIQLSYGRWLRRRHRVAESRAPLRAARDTFDALGFANAAEYARQELRAAGDASQRRTSNAWDQLTPQELQIARLAVDGLTNREIAQQLFLSHHTIGYHLHHIFTKVGVTSRSQLHSVLPQAT
jgi:DNA-binding CsgD family transcriptional regulator